MALPGLDDSQRRFCEAPAGNIRLLAPAGCGKTLSLLFRCLHLANQTPQRSQRFLLVTFTVAAKQELAARLNEDPRLEAIRDQLEITTLNSWGLRRIKNIASYPKLISSKDDYFFTMRNLLQPIWSKHPKVKAAIEKRSNVAPRQIMEIIDSFKSIGFDHQRHTSLELFSARLAELREQGVGLRLDEIIDELVKLGVLDSVVDKSGEESAQAADRLIYSSFFEFWREATAHLIDSATFTLEDQKYVAYLDERAKLEAGKHLTGASSYDHILVDEFQDINPLDLALLKAIAERNRSTVTIVGDDDQALFEWRGATPEYILNPERFWGVAFSTYTLGVNYRSPANIVTFSQNLIRHNERRESKEIRPAVNELATIEITQPGSLSEAMDAVHKEIQRIVGDGSSPNRIAIVGRKKSQIIPYQIFFASNGIAFCAAEDLQVFLSKTFERLLEIILIRARAGGRQIRTEVINDALKLCGLVKRYPLSKADYQSLRRHLSQGSIGSLADAADAVASYRGSLKGANADGRVSTSMAEAIHRFLAATSVSEALTELGANFEGLKVDIGKAEDDIFFVDPPFLHLAEFATRYGDDYAQFIDDVERAKEQLVYVPPFNENESSLDDVWKRPVHLMTAIRAKGKEFDSVVLLDVNDGIWPNKNARTPEQHEAERRVFYVAFTRARKKVMMLISDRIAGKPVSPSPFVYELGIPEWSREQATLGW